MRIRVLLILIFFAVCATTAPIEAGEGATRVNRALVQLQQPKTDSVQENFRITESDLNDFFDAVIREKRGTGIEKVEIDLQEGGRITVAARVNMDEVQLSGPAAALLTGSLKGIQILKAAGRLEVTEGRGTCTISEASINEVVLPAWLANTFLGYVTESQPPYTDITEFFELPYGITDVQIHDDLVVIVR